MYKIKIQYENFSLEKEIQEFDLSKTGAIVSFVGLVRDFNNTSKLTSLTLDCYTDMAYKEIEKIVQVAIEKFTLENVTLIHKIGKIKAHEQIVLVLVSSAHRKESFLGCEYIIDYLKLKAPFFKQETNINNQSEWVKTNEKI